MIKTKAERIRPQGMEELLISGQDTPDKSLAESLDSLSVEGVCKWLRWTNLFLLWPFLLFLLPLTKRLHPRYALPSYSSGQCQACPALWCQTTAPPWPGRTSQGQSWNTAAWQSSGPCCSAPLVGCYYSHTVHSVNAEHMLKFSINILST